MMNIKNGFCWVVGLVMGMFALHGNGAESWDIGNNSVTYSVFVDNFELGFGKTKIVELSQLSLNEVASQEGVGTSANYGLSSVVLSMNGLVYGTIYYKNNSSTATQPYFVTTGNSRLTYGSVSTPDENYAGAAPIGTVAAFGSYTDNDVSLVGSATPKTVEITTDLNRFLGTGTIETIGAFPADGYFSTGGSDWNANVALRGSADITVTYHYTWDNVPEPSSMALVIMGCTVLALRRKYKKV